MEGGNITEKVKTYRDQRPNEIIKDLNTFINKGMARSFEDYTPKGHAMMNGIFAQVAAALDVPKYGYDTENHKNILDNYDQRTLLIENGTFVSTLR